MKKLACILTVLVVFLSVAFCFSTNVFAQDIQVGDSDVYYNYNEQTKTLTFSGEGVMPNFKNTESGQPWYKYRTEIEHVIIEEGITTIGAYALYNVTASDIRLPSTLTELGTYSLAFTSGVTSWDLPDSITYIAGYAFYSCVNMESISLPSQLKTIYTRAFQNCSSLEEILIPSSVTSIATYAFNNCRVLRNVEFESMSSRIALGSYAFTQCPMLTSISVPLNATCGMHFYGYKDNSNKYSGIKMYVYDGSLAQSYAEANKISTVLLESIPVKLGEKCFNEYRDSNVSNTYHYSFVAPTSERYCLYTIGGVDTTGELYSNGRLLDTNDDMCSGNRNLFFEIDCVEGQVYDVYVSSYNSQGEFYFTVMPSEIESFEIKGEYEMSSSDATYIHEYPYYYFDESVLDGMEFVITFKNGMTDSFIYENDIYNGKEIAFSHNQEESPLHCGNNDYEIKIGNYVSAFNVVITHSYTRRAVEPTPDEDGYYVYSCSNCDDSYKDDYFKTDKQIYTLSGKCVLDENRFGEHTVDYPYFLPTIKVDGRSYVINEDGSWTIRTFKSCKVVFDNPYGKNSTLVYNIDIDNPDSYYGIVALDGYDLDMNGKVNAVDYVIYKKQMYDKLGEGYWQFGNEYISLT